MRSVMKTKTIDKFEAIKFASLTQSYWHLSSCVIEEIIKHNNPSSLFTDRIASDEEYDLHTKWSDMNIATPLLFNIYHGIELSLKALLMAKNINVNKNHDLATLAANVKTAYNEIDFEYFYNHYITTEALPIILANFCKASNINMSMYYQSLKYPTSTKGSEFKHTPLHYNEEAGCQFFQELKDDINVFFKKIERVIMNECKDVL